MRSKVLFVIPNMTSGGAERVFLHLLNNLDRKKFEPVLAVGELRGEFLAEIKSDVSVIELNAIRARSAIGPLIKTVWRLRPNVIMSTLGMNLAAALGKPFFPKGVRIILREGNSPTAFLDDVKRKSRIRAGFYQRCYKYLYQLADLVICQSDFMKADMERTMGVPASKLKRIHNPINFEQIGKMSSEKTDQTSLPRQIRLNTVGRLSFQKAYDNLLRAFVIVRTVYSNSELTFIGQGEDEASLKELTRTLHLENHVHFLGFRSNPYAYTARSNIFVLPSRYEGFSNALVEALACGVPAVVTDCPSANREVITEGFNGWFAKPDDADDLAAVMIKAIGKIETIDRRAIIEDCRSKYSLDVIIPQYEQAMLG